MIILGIDPGTTRVGYGVIKKEKNRFAYITSGLLDVRGSLLGDRLVGIRQGIERLLKTHNIDCAGVEKLFFEKNRKTAIAVAHGRGVVLEVFTAHGVPVVEIAPTEVKVSLTGDGHATKGAVAKMTHHFLDVDVSEKIDDVTDALAVAIAAAGMYPRE
jgi:crossover junction endodeoxyribonuclease RuvC